MDPCISVNTPVAPKIINTNPIMAAIMVCWLCWVLAMMLCICMAAELPIKFFIWPYNFPSTASRPKKIPANEMIMMRVGPSAKMV